MERHTFDTFSFIGAIVFAAAAVATLVTDQWPSWSGFSLAWIGPLALIAIGLVLLIPRRPTPTSLPEVSAPDPVIRQAREELPPEADLS